MFSSIAWISRTLAPWCTAAGVLVSLTADAGQETAFGASSSLITTRAALVPDELIPARRALLMESAATATSPRPLPRLSPRPIVEARLHTGTQTDLDSRPDEIEPRRVLKSGPDASPDVNRSARGDPFVGLRPTFETHLRGAGGLAAARVSAVVFGVDDRLPVSSFEAGRTPASPDGALLFTLDAGFLPVDRLSLDRLHAGLPALADGATPALPRAVTLAATTPGLAEPTPVTVGMVALVLPKADTVIARALDQPDFAALIDPKSAQDEETCLAQAVYFEARSEPDAGKAAVAQVVLNRVKTGLYADSVCGVVFQNQHRYKACQFSFACEGKSLRINDLDSWQTAQRIAREVIGGSTWLADVGTSTHYHANYVRPYWAARLHRMEKIGHHIFYRQPNG